MSLDRYGTFHSLSLPRRKKGREADDRVCMLSFSGLGGGRMTFSGASLVIGWIGCVVLDLGQVEGMFFGGGGLINGR